jgi:L-Ala-D/L-Glu epimerase
VSARLLSLEVRPLSVALEHPFVIATAEMSATESVLVHVQLEHEGRRATGVCEAAALPGVTWETQRTLMELGRDAGAHAMRHPQACDAAELDVLGGGSRVLRAGIEGAIMDARGKLDGRSVAAELSGRDIGVFEMTTDITLGIAPPEVMAARAGGYRQRGFRAFKVKVGRSLRDDIEALTRVQEAVSDARFRLDANEGYRAADALRLLERTLEAGCVIECFEQPCAREDRAGMAEVTARSSVPILADESLRSEEDFDRIAGERLAHGVNLKLVKLGGPRAAYALGTRAKANRMPIMAGAMVETRLGLTCMAHVVAALGGVDFVDLDTALLLTDDPIVGGMDQRDASIALPVASGLGVRAVYDAYTD